MAAGDDHWKNKIREKICELFMNERPEDFVRIQWYLDEEDKAYMNTGMLPPVWKTLKSALQSDNVFKIYAERLCEDTKRAERDVEFRKTMSTMYQEALNASENPASSEQGQGLNLAVVPYNFQKGQWLGLVRVAFIVVCEKANLGAARVAVTAVDEGVGMVSKSVGSVVMVALAVTWFTVETTIHLYRWWRGEISGLRCAKNVVDSLVSITAGVGGGIGGAAVGSLFGPAGTVIGGIIGGAASSAIASLLIDRLTQWLFGLPKTEALENAYKFLGVKMTDSNVKVNQAFHDLCRKYHPDKGGKQEDFIKLQACMETIRQARG